MVGESSVSFGRPSEAAYRYRMIGLAYSARGGQGGLTREPIASGWLEERGNWDTQGHAGRRAGRRAYRLSVVPSCAPPQPRSRRCRPHLTPQDF